MLVGGLTVSEYTCAAAILKNFRQASMSRRHVEFYSGTADPLNVRVILFELVYN